MKLHIEYQS